MKRKLMYHVFRGKRYRIRFCGRIKTKLGECDNPKNKNKQIIIKSSLMDCQLLTILLHESLHACLWDFDEPAIQEISSDIADFLWKLGYRLQDGN